MVAGVFSKSFYDKVNFYDHNSAMWDATVEENGTLTTTPSVRNIGFASRVSDFFTFHQNEDLLAVNQKLVAIVDQVKKRSGSFYERLKKEVHKEGLHAYYMLCSNLLSLNGRFASGNTRNSLTELALKVVNFFRSLLGYEPLKFQTYEELDLGPLGDLLRLQETGALQLTAAERAHTPYRVDIVSGRLKDADSDPAAVFNAENVMKLQWGLSDGIRLQSGDQIFWLKYDRQEGEFRLSYGGKANKPDLRKKLDEEGSFVITEEGVVEKRKLPGREKLGTVHFTYTMEGKREEGWFSPRKDSFAFKPSGQYAVLKPGSEFTLLPSDQNEEPVALKISLNN